MTAYKIVVDSPTPYYVEEKLPIILLSEPPLSIKTTATLNKKYSDDIYLRVAPWGDPFGGAWPPNEYVDAGSWFGIFGGNQWMIECKDHRATAPVVLEEGKTISLELRWNTDYSADLFVDNALVLSLPNFTLRIVEPFSVNAYRSKWTLDPIEIETDLTSALIFTVAPIATGILAIIGGK